MDYNGRQYYIPPRKTEDNSGRKKIVFFFVCVMVVWAFILITQDSTAKSNYQKSLQSISLIQSLTRTYNAVVLGKSLQKTVESHLPKDKGTYAIAVKNLKTGEQYYYNQDESFDSASLYKLWVMATVYNQVQNGRLSEDESIQENIADLNDTFNIASSSAELKSGTISVTVSSALHQMITISHNYSALALSNRIGLSSVTAFLRGNGFTSSNLGSRENDLPTTTAKDTAVFFEKLYKGELANKTYTDKMITLLKKQQLNNKMPKYLPKDTVVAHKTGELDMVSHDGGIVYTKNGDYIFVMLSKTSYPPHAEEEIAKMSQAVYEYFTQ